MYLSKGKKSENFFYFAENGDGHVSRKKSKKEACILGIGRAVPEQEVPTQLYLDFVIRSLQLDQQPRVVEAIKKVRLSSILCFFAIVGECPSTDLTWCDERVVGSARLLRVLLPRFLARQLADRSDIDKRYFCSADPMRPREEWKILPQDFPNSVPSMTVRNKYLQSRDVGVGGGMA